MPSPRSRLLSAACLTCALMLLIVALICLGNPRQTLLYMLDIFTVPLLGAGVLLSLVLLIARQGLASVFGLAACLILLTAAWPQAGPMGPQSQSSHHTHTARIVFANLYFLNRHPERLAVWAKAQQADIVAVAEVTPPIWDAMDAAMCDTYPYRIKSGEIGLFSRWPMQPLIQTGWHFAAVGIKTPSGALDLIAAHFDHPDSRARPNSDPFIDRLQNLIGRIDVDRSVIIGDFNSDMSGYLLQDMARRNRLKALPAINGTWPSPLPGLLRVNLDNAFAGSSWRLSGRRIGPSIGSDHRPIAFDIDPSGRWRHDRKLKVDPS